MISERLNETTAFGNKNLEHSTSRTSEPRVQPVITPEEAVALNKLLHQNQGTHSLNAQEIIDALRFLRQTDTKEYMRFLYRLLSKDFKQIEWFGGDYELLKNDLCKLDPVEQAKLHACNSRQRAMLENKFYKKQTAAAKFLHPICQNILKLFKLVQAGFPNMSQEQFEKEIFFYEGGLKSLIEAMLEAKPIKAKKNKKARGRTKPVNIAEAFIRNERTKITMQIISEFLQEKAKEHQAPAIQSLVDDLKNIFGFTEDV